MPENQEVSCDRRGVNVLKERWRTCLVCVFLDSLDEVGHDEVDHLVSPCVLKGDISTDEVVACEESGSEAFL